jgi:ribosomal-protein-alanine N-acetyltransferase
VQSEYGELIYITITEIKQLLEKWKKGYSNPDFYRWAIIENIIQIAFCRVYSDCKTAEIEYCIGEKFWSNRYANEALSAVIDYVFANTDFHFPMLNCIKRFPSISLSSLIHLRIRRKMVCKRQKPLS